MGFKLSTIMIICLGIQINANICKIEKYINNSHTNLYSSIENVTEIYMDCQNKPCFVSENKLKNF